VTFLPGARYQRRMESNRLAMERSSSGTIAAPGSIRQRLTEDEQTAALVMVALVAVTAARPDAVPDEPEHDLEAAVWDVLAEGRELEPERWLARVGYLRDGYRRDRARRTRLRAAG
jgi:hypothetical protein